MDILLDGKKQFTLKNNIYFLMKCSPIFFWSFEMLNVMFILNTAYILYFKILFVIQFAPFKIISSIFLGACIGNLPFIAFWGIHYLIRTNIEYFYKNMVTISDVEIHFNEEEIRFKIKSSIFCFSKKTIFLEKNISYKITNRGIFFYVDKQHYLFYISKQEQGYIEFIQNLRRMKEGF